MVDDVVGSEMPTFPSQQKLNNSGYGQNGYAGPSSDTPGKHTTSGFLPQAVIPTHEEQTREVSAKGYPTHPGMRDRNAVDIKGASVSPAKIPAVNTHRAAGPITNSSFQR